MNPRRRHGFSLLEVLLATGILIGAAVVLIELVTIGNRHASSARDLSKSQMICQTRLNEILAGALPLEAVRPTPLDGDPQWVCWVELQSTDQPGFTAVEVGAAHQPSPQKQAARFTLVRWMRDPRAAGDSQRASPSPAPAASSAQRPPLRRTRP